ncbi:8-amino-7-oxononanoate synthase [Lihuaxuella thermophila]|uniref:8-amino-7-ketopelargonate synthase n=1 Tax=Lihuaxuella thermophila TaxID=1173111 RepID=A0A1H8CCJ2_9BACL|nr:8-amino-7-oxononanoate synthase [Lihuaxuella thermophila]SEM92726.1 8-amino-7-oxononanoate synthase [Lihuaxuella thermophila]
MSRSWDSFIQQELARLASLDLKRELIPVERAVQPVCIRQGEQMINFSSNNYLGLAGHPELVKAMQQAAGRGAGATASRLILGHDPEMERLEEEIARFKGTEAALVFGSGYMANVGVLSAFLSKSDAVFSDQLNHASIVDGIRLSGAKHYRFRHRDLDHLEKMLKDADAKGYKRKWIVTDTIFSMDGDTAPLAGLVQLKEKYEAALMVDDAHGSGVFGPNGEGYPHQLGLQDRIDLTMGTFSKAFGVYGAYVAGKKDWIRFLVHKCRSFIYTTGLPPAVTGGIRAALTLVKNGQELRRRLRDQSGWFRDQLLKRGFDLAGSTTHIVPVVIGGSGSALAFSRFLSERGILAVAIRPPTVPEGKARLRFSLMANHTEEDLAKAVEVISEAGRELGVI